MNKYAASILLSFCAATAGAASNWTIVADLDLREAIHSYDKAIAIKPGYGEAYSNRGIALLELKRVEEAVASYDKAVAIKPDYAEAYSNRGIALVELQRLEEALDSFDKSLIICDEIHNVYNSVDINNWGLCLKVIFNYHAAKNSIRVLLLSATPINNKPVEIISLLELLNTNLRIKKNTIFDSN
jgi:tetratricopeptide (TPR) repeat protein